LRDAAIGTRNAISEKPSEPEQLKGI